MKKDEGEAMALLGAHEAVIMAAIPRYEGSVIKGTGDGFLVEFGSVLAAAECAASVQRRMKLLRKGKDVRISVHVGDVIHKDGDIFGDAVNIASQACKRTRNQVESASPDKSTSRYQVR